MELVTQDEAAQKLGITKADVEQMICDGALLAVRFASGTKVVLDPQDPPPPHAA